MKKDGNEDKQKAQYSLPSGSTRGVTVNFTLLLFLSNGLK